MSIWMTCDPETERIAFRDREPDDGSFPPGPRGRGWEIRRAELDEAVWDDLMAARISPADQDALHQAKWAEGVTP